MKIFGKRKKKAASGELPAAARSKNSSDKVVQELLQLDPSEWNAKQRRMVKRFKERNVSNDEQVAAQTNREQNTKGTANSSNNDTPSERTTQNENVQDLKEKEASKEELKETGANPNDKEDKSSSGSEDESSSDSEQSGTEQSPPLKAVAGSKAVTEVSETGDSSTSSSEHAKEKQERSEENHKVAMDDSNSDKKKVLELIQGLNSKQRRKFTRQLERDGDGALEQIHKEALALTRQKEEQVAQSETDIALKQQQVQKQSDESLTKQQKGKKRKQTDWSDLPPEERIRREEQRRLQKEAAERRANGIVPLKKHPLNSERRRANRRKPKWAAARKTSSIPENEHNSSGYHMRKIKKTMQTS